MGSSCSGVAALERLQSLGGRSPGEPLTAVPLQSRHVPEEQWPAWPPRLGPLSPCLPGDMNSACSLSLLLRTSFSRVLWPENRRRRSVRPSNGDSAVVAAWGLFIRLRGHKSSHPPVHHPRPATGRLLPPRPLKGPHFALSPPSPAPRCSPWVSKHEPHHVAPLLKVLQGLPVAQGPSPKPLLAPRATWPLPSCPQPTLRLCWSPRGRPAARGAAQVPEGSGTLAPVSPSAHLPKSCSPIRP